MSNRTESNSSSGIALLSIRPEHAQRIYSGQKLVELRKSFSSDAGPIVFLYETKPVSAITGAILIERAVRTAVDEAARLAVEGGVPRERALEYFRGRELGWVIKIGLALNLHDYVSAREAKSLNHYFAVPQAFQYLSRGEALTQLLLRRFAAAAEAHARLEDASADGRAWLANQLKPVIGAHYAGIDDGFVRQSLAAESGEDMPFSTVRKRVLELWLGRLSVGLMVATQKCFGAVKTGPTILREAYRGIGLGVLLRRLFVQDCQAKGVRKLYCTAPVDSSRVIGYLLASGMTIEARLTRHLSERRDEMVLAHTIRESRGLTCAASPLPIRSRLIKSVENISPQHSRLKGIAQYVFDNLHHWYFRPMATLCASLIAGVERWRCGQGDPAEKPRIIWGALSSKGVCRAAVVGTLKRGSMLKLNCVSDVEDAAAIKMLIEQVVGSYAMMRRFYLTLPTARVSTVLGLVELGFRMEGVLSSPFMDGVDHVCLGLNRDSAHVL